MASMKKALTTILALSCSFLMLVDASDFLRSSPHEHSESVSEDDIRMGLMEAIDSSLPNSKGLGSASTRFAQIEASLRPIYASLPKNEHGNLEHSVARYGLHRLFVGRHGWVIQGLGPQAGKFNASSPAGVLKDQVPSFIEDLFEQRLKGKGFRLSDLAVLASVIEHLIQQDGIRRIGDAFKIHDEQGTGLLIDDSGKSQVKEMLDTYMSGYILSQSLADMMPEDAQKLRTEISELFNYWGETQQFVYGIHQRVTVDAKLKDPSASDHDLVALTQVAEAVGDQFGTFFHNTVCKKMKDSLMQIEYQGTGRIRLSDFYKPALDGFWQFQESVGYLRQLGVLEETDPKEPRVMIANYLNAPANCIASSGFYSSCCKNECEDLLGHLEQKIAAPEATPATIAAIVVDLQSSTVSAPRVLSASLLQRLNEIADNHGGRVLLHGRLFAQWMHHAYPRECPYPHISGTTSPTLPEEWIKDTDSEPTASEEEMRQYIQWGSSSAASEDTIEDLMTWSSEEEVLVVRPIGGYGELPWETKARSPAVLRSMLLFVIASFLAVAMIKTTQASLFTLPSKKFAI